MKSQKWELCPRGFNEAHFQNVAFRGMQGNVLNILVIRYLELKFQFIDIEAP